MGEKKERTERVRKVTVEQIEKALKENAGILSLSANYIKKVYGIEITRQALCYRVNKSKKLQEIRNEARETILDKAESVLVKELIKGNWKVAFSLLRTLGKNRGYGTESVVNINNSNVQQNNVAKDIDLSKFSKEEILEITKEAFKKDE